MVTQLERPRFPKPDDMKMLVRRVAPAFGVDVDRPRNDLDEAVRAALDDLDSGPYLRSCAHLAVDRGHGGLVSELFGLPTQYRIRCEKHLQRRVEYMRQSGAFRAFSTTWCSSCPDRAPRPDGWQPP